MTIRVEKIKLGGWKIKLGGWNRWHLVDDRGRIHSAPLVEKDRAERQAADEREAGSHPSEPRALYLESSKKPWTSVGRGIRIKVSDQGLWKKGGPRMVDSTEERWTGGYLFTDDGGWTLAIEPRSIFDGERENPGGVEPDEWFDRGYL